MNKKKLTIVGIVSAIILVFAILFLLRFTPEPVIKFFASTQKHNVELKLEKKYSKEFDVLEATDCYQGTKSFLTEQIRKFGCYVYKYRAVCLEDDIEFDVEYRTDPSNVRFEDNYVFVSNIISNDYTKQIEDAYATVFPEHTVSATWNTEIQARSRIWTKYWYNININIDAPIDDCLVDTLPESLRNTSRSSLLSAYESILSGVNEKDDVVFVVVLHFKDVNSPKIEFYYYGNHSSNLSVCAYHTPGSSHLDEKYANNDIIKKICEDRY